MTDSPNPPSPPSTAVADAVWRWRTATPASSAAEPAALLRRQGLVRASIGGAIATVLYLFGFPRLAAVGGGISALVGLAALASPGGLYRAIGRGFEAFGRFAGKLIGFLTLTPVFFVFFAIFGRLLRSGRRDRLARFFDRTTSSYWLRRDDPAPSAARYERSF